MLAHLLLTGFFPFSGGTAAARREAVQRYAEGTEELRLSAELPDVWRPIVTDCLTADHRARAAHDARFLLTRVRAAGAGGSPRLPRLRRHLSRRGALAIAVGAAALLLTAAVLSPLNDGSGDDPASEAADYGADELATDAGIPVDLRKLIVDAARECDQEEVTAPLIAALLKVESDFDTELHDPENDEYGVARWTPSVLHYWIPSADRPAPDTPPEPPLTPEMSIPAVGLYLCHVSPRIDQDLNYDHQVAITVAHRSSWELINEWGGVPEQFREYADEVAHYLAQYTPDK
jgi:hypothetical protein